MDNKILLVTEQGSWAILSKKKYDDLLCFRLDEDTLTQLEMKGIVITENNTDTIIKMEMKRRAFLRYPPGLHIILPTIRCNQQCVYCHSSAKPDIVSEDTDMNIDTAKRTVDFIISTPSKDLKIEFQGGDSLLRFDIVKEIVRYARKKGKETRKKIIFALVTNATLLSEEKLNWLKEKKVSLTTSLDGPEKVHDKNRVYWGGKGTYKDVIRRIKFCKEQGIRIGALMVTSRYSLPYAKEIVDDYLNLGMRSIQLKFLNKIGFAEEQWQKIGYTPQEYLKFWKEAMEYIIQKNLEGEYIVENFTNLILKKIVLETEPGFLDFRSPCGVALGQIAYNYNGDIYSCDEGRGFDIFRLGNVHNTTFHDYARNQNTHKLVESSILETTYCDTCIYKPYCGTCPVLNYAQQGNLIPKIATNDRCKILKGQFDWVFEKIIKDDSARKVFSKWLKNAK